MYIVFSTTNSLISRIIRFILKSKISHAALLTDIQGIPIIVDAGWTGIEPKTYDKWIKSNTIIKVFEPKVALDLKSAVEHFGTKYDYVGLFGYFFVVMGRWMKIKFKNKLASPRKMICSEFIFTLDPKRQLEEFQGKDPETTDPVTLAGLLSSGSNFIEVTDKFVK